MIRVNLKEKWNGEIFKQKGKKVINKSIYEIGLVVEGQAKELCARKYGYLAASINTQSSTEGTELESPGKYAKETPPEGHNIDTFQKIEKPNREGLVYVGSHVDYAIYKEMGTIKMNADPYLRPALALAKGETLEIVQINGKKYFLGYLKEHETYLQSRGI